MRRLLLYACAVFLLALMAAPDGAFAKSCGLRQCVGVHAGVTAYGVTITAYDGGGNAYDYSPASAPEAGAKYVWTLIPACPRNKPGGDDLLCYGATVGCPIAGDVHWRIYYRNLDPAVNDQWHLAATQCLSSNPLLDIAAVKAAVDKLFHEDLPLPGGTLHVQPPDGALVNLPTILYTDTTQQLHFAVKALGVLVNVTATPTEYVWHFGDGATATTTSPGHPHPNEDVTHTYTQPASGLAPYVTVVWSGTYTISGFEETFTINGTVSRDGPPLSLLVREARAELVGG
jgi:hypothetical protein